MWANQNPRAAVECRGAWLVRLPRKIDAVFFITITIARVCLVAPKAGTWDIFASYKVLILLTFLDKCSRRPTLLFPPLIASNEYPTPDSRSSYFALSPSSLLAELALKGGCLLLLQWAIPTSAACLWLSLSGNSRNRPNQRP